MTLSKSAKRLAIYDRIHKFSIIGILGLSAVAAGVFMYNVYLFKKGNFCCKFFDQNFCLLIS